MIWFKLWLNHCFVIWFSVKVCDLIWIWFGSFVIWFGILFKSFGLKICDFELWFALHRSAVVGRRERHRASISCKGKGATPVKHSWCLSVCRRPRACVVWPLWCKTQIMCWKMATTREYVASSHRVIVKWLGSKPVTRWCIYCSQYCCRWGAFRSCHRFSDEYVALKTSSKCRSTCQQTFIIFTSELVIPVYSDHSMYHIFCKNQHILCIFPHIMSFSKWHWVYNNYFHFLKFFTIG